MERHHHRVSICCVDSPAQGFFYFSHVFEAPQALNNLLTEHLSVMKLDILPVPVPQVCLRLACNKHLLIIWLLAVLASFRRARGERMSGREEKEGREAGWEGGREGGRKKTVSSRLTRARHGGPLGVYSLPSHCCERPPQPSAFKSF